jgi:tetratricopeptide (TPR) repeat protein
VHGDVTPLAGASVLTVRLVAAESGDEFASFRESVSGAKDLIPALDKLTRALRSKIGESLRSVSASAPLEQVTTPSLEALKKYAEALHVLRDVNYPDAIRLLKEAIALDTSFAMAYRKLATVLNNTGLPHADRDSAFARAYRYRHRLTERERLHTVASYYKPGPGRDRAQSAAAYEDLLSRYPTDGPALNTLAFIYLERREYARAETLLRRIPQVDSGQWNPNLVSALFDVGKTAAADSARATAARVSPRAPQGLVLDVPLVQASYGLDSVARLLDAARAKPDAFTRSLATRQRAEVALARGRLSEALALLASAHAIDSARGTFVPALYDSVKAAWMEVWFRGNARRAVRRLDAALLTTPLRTVSALGEEPYFSVATVYALAGRPDKARTILARYRAEVRDTAQLRMEEPASHKPLAEIALAERRPHDAVKEFRLAETAPDGPAHGCASCTYAALARAFDQAAMPDSAIAYFARYLDTPYLFRLDGGRLEVSVDAANLAGAYKRLGELYDARGDRQKAASYYRKFVELWKNADPELQPTVAEVRQRLARAR